MMDAYWLGVVATKEGYQRLLDDAETWWCGNDAVKGGDRMLMYCAKSVAPKLSGVFCEYAVTGQAPDHAADCRSYGGAVGGVARSPIGIRLLKRYDVPLTSTKIKEDSVLCSARFVRRNYQGTLFQLSKMEYRRLLALLTEVQEASA